MYVGKYSDSGRNLSVPNQVNQTVKHHCHDLIPSKSYFSPETTLNTIPIEYGIFGEGSQISTNQKRGNGAFSLLIG